MKHVTECTTLNAFACKLACKSDKQPSDILKATVENNQIWQKEQTGNESSEHPGGAKRRMGGKKRFLRNYGKNATKSQVLLWLMEAERHNVQRGC